MTTLYKSFPIELRLHTGHILTKNINTVCIDDKEYVDLKSVIQAMYMSWSVWGMYLRGCAAEFGLVRHEDEYLQGTVIVRPYGVHRLLCHLYGLPTLQKRMTVLHRLYALQQQWFTCWRDRQEQAGEPPQLESRKVTPELIRELHALLQAHETFKVAAQRLGINGKIARRIANGNYRMDEACTLTWCKTFGGMRPKTRRAGVFSAAGA